MDADCVRCEPRLDRGPSWAGCSRYTAASAAAAACLGGFWLRVRKVLVLHPATLAAVGHVPEPVADGFGDSEFGPFIHHRHHRRAIPGLSPHIQISGGVLATGDLEPQDRSDRLRGGTLGFRHRGDVDWRSRDAPAELLLSCSCLAGRRVDRRGGWSWIRNLCVITWHYCTGDAYAQRRDDCRWNCDSCCARRQGRPHGPSWARSRHVFSIPREK